jgi:hypothetical protein
MKPRLVRRDSKPRDDGYRLPSIRRYTRKPSDTPDLCKSDGLTTVLNFPGSWAGTLCSIILLANRELHSSDWGSVEWTPEALFGRDVRSRPARAPREIEDPDFFEDDIECQRRVGAVMAYPRSPI